jgi:hypothetical protein
VSAAPRRLVTVTAVVEVPADYDYDEDAGRAFEGALALVPGTSFGVVTEGVSEAALALGARHAFPWLPAPETAPAAAHLHNVIISERDIGPAHLVCTIEGCDDSLCEAEDADTLETLTGVALDHYTAKHAGTTRGTPFGDATLYPPESVAPPRRVRIIRTSRDVIEHVDAKGNEDVIYLNDDGASLDGFRIVRDGEPDAAQDTARDTGQEHPHDFGDYSDVQ